MGVPVIFFLCAYWLMPIAEMLQFDPDEGIELAKVTLYSKGYRLYDQIWNDQPPLLTVLLAAWLQLFGHSIVAARLLILTFSAVLVGAFHSTLRLSLKPAYALIGTLGLCLTFGFLRFSVSVMRGLPALSLAMLAIYFLSLGLGLGRTKATNFSANRSVRQAFLWTAASGVCFGIALQIKFIVLLIAPACLLQILYSRHDDPASKQQVLRLAATWSFGVSATFLVVGLLTHAFHPAQLIETHLNAANQAHLQRDPSWLLLLMFLAQDLDCSLLAGLAVGLILARRLKAPALPLCWLLTVLIVLSFHQPLWDHYYPLIAVPVVWLATSALAQCFPSLGRRCRRPALQEKPIRSPLQRCFVALMIVAVVLAPVKLGVTAVFNHQFVRASEAQRPVLEALQKFQPQTRWLFTDLPITAFYANLKVPPELAVFSTKRIESGNLSIEFLRKALQTYRPEQVLLGRYAFIERSLKPDLDRDYLLKYRQGEISLYVLKSLVEAQMPAALKNP